MICPDCGKEYKKLGSCRSHLHKTHKWDKELADIWEPWVSEDNCKFCGKALINPGNPTGCTSCGKWVGEPLTITSTVREIQRENKRNKKK